jgi:hypothetical protein
MASVGWDPCPVVLTNGDLIWNETGDTYREEADKILTTYNTILESVTAEYGYHFVSEATRTSFILNDLSTYDCFHPSIDGQQKIAEITWTNGLYD